MATTTRQDKEDDEKRTRTRGREVAAPCRCHRQANLPQSGGGHSATTLCRPARGGDKNFGPVWIPPHGYSPQQNQQSGHKLSPSDHARATCDADGRPLWPVHHDKNTVHTGVAAAQSGADSEPLHTSARRASTGQSVECSFLLAAHHAGPHSARMPQPPGTQPWHTASD